MTAKTRQFAFPIAIVLMLLLTGCGSPAKRYEEATALYRSMQYAQAAKKFQQLKDFEDSASMAEKCEMLAS